MKITSASSEEEREAFRAAVLAKSQATAPEGALPLCEHAYASLLSSLWTDAVWFETVPAFPNGLPLDAQHPVKLRVWNTFLAAINRRAARSSGGGRHGR